MDYEPPNNLFSLAARLSYRRSALSQSCGRLPLMVALHSKLLKWMPWLAGAAFFLLYTVTAAPGIVEFFDDTLEFQLVLPTFGIAHPTGYPLYTILGGVWSRVLFPFGEWAWRVNVLSALFGGAAVGLGCALTQHIVEQSVEQSAGSPTSSKLAANAPIQELASSPAWAGLAAALLFGLAPVWWSQTTVAEVYALHNLLVAAILLAAIWTTNAGSAASDGEFVRRMSWLCLLIGLGLAHHRTTLLLLPALVVYFAADARLIWRVRRAWPTWIAALLAPLLLYLFIPLRASMGITDLNGSYANTWQGFWDHVLARQYTAFFADNPLAVTRSWNDWLALFVSQLGWLGLALAIFGLIAAFRPGVRRAGLLLAIVAMTNLLFALSYRVGDTEVFVLPVWLCMAIFAGVGVAAIGQLVQRWPKVSVVVQGGLLALLLIGVTSRGPTVDRSQDWAAHDLAIAMTAADFPPTSQVIGLEGEMTAIRYMQQANGRALAAEPVVANDEAQRRALLDQAIAVGRPAYLTRELPGSESQYSFGGDGALVRVWPRGATQPGAPQHALDEVMAGGALHLLGYDLRTLEGTGHPSAEVALYWQPQQPLTATLKLSLRVVDSTGNTLIGADGAPLVQDLFPLRMVALTPAWLPGKVVRDVYQIDLPPDGTDANLLVIVYDVQTVAEVGRWQVKLSS